VAQKHITQCLITNTWFQIQKGANASRADDTKGMKGAIIDWITPHGQTLTPPLSRRNKSDRGFHHEQTGALLCPAGVDWNIPQCVLPSFLYRFSNTSLSRIKDKLRSGEMHVRGDQWPIFLYADLAYDRDDPWHGLLRSQLLVSVSMLSQQITADLKYFFRPTSTSLHPPVP